MLSPLYFVLPIIGGVSMMIALRVIDHYSINKHSSYSVLALLLIAPFVVGSIERQSSPPESLRYVEVQVVVNAGADAVWNQITSVPDIQPEEHSFSGFQLIGVPRPQQASLPVVEVGAVRTSSWEDGVAFVETITNFEPNRFLDFSMSLDPEADVPEPFSEIGGRYFDVIGGGYRIEPIGENQVILSLHSTHRLSTRINAYGGLWTDYIMWDLQHYILSIVKARAEKY